MVKLLVVICFLQFFSSFNCHSLFNSLKPIGNGEKVDIGQFPYMVQLFPTTDSGKQSLCGGALISTKWVLTAGHCCRGKIYAHVYFGATRLKNKPPAEGSSHMKSYDLRLHPKTEDGDLNYDIGIVGLPKEVALSDTIKLIRFIPLL